METGKELITKIAELKTELAEKYHIRSLGIFGSAVRRDFSPKSDIDLLVEFKKPVGIEFIELAEILENRLKRPVDLVSRNGVKEKYLKSILEDIIYV